MFLVMSTISYAKEKGTGDLGSAALEASDYSLCLDLKIRAPKGDEVLIQVNCENIIESFELSLERKALTKRIVDIDTRLKFLKENKNEIE